MNNIRKTKSGFLSFGILATFAFCGTTAAGATISGNHISRTPNSSALTRKLSADDFVNEEALSHEELGVSIVQNTITDNSQALTVSFRSVTLKGYRTAIGNYIVGVDDPNFTGDDSNPVEEGYDGPRDSSGLPLFEGYLAYIKGSSSNENNKKVYVPSTLTKAGAFSIKVTTIGENCVTADGAEYSGSCWKEEDPFEEGQYINRITDVYIPSTITKVKSHAFSGFPTDKSVVMHYEGIELKSNIFEDGWIDADTSDEDSFDISPYSYALPSSKKANVGGSETIPDPLGRPLSFILGSHRVEGDPTYDDPIYDCPLVIQYDLVTYTGELITGRVTHYEAVKVLHDQNPYDSCGPINAPSYTREFGFRIKDNERVDASSVLFHNIRRSEDHLTIDTSKTYSAKPSISYSEVQSLSNLVSVSRDTNSTFAGYSLFKLRMDKNLSIVSQKYPQPHSLYLDVKTDIYEQNKANIESGKTKIRYSLYNLHTAQYYFEYIGDGGEKKSVEIEITDTMEKDAIVTYQILEKDTNNLVSVLLKNSKVAPDFAANRVTMFEIRDLTIQMDLLTVNDSGSTSKLGKSQISYKFAYITVFSEEEPVSAFSWNLFLVIFLFGFVALYAVCSYAFYRVTKEKFKNDEFRRVNGKKFLKKAFIGGLGSLVMAIAILFITMRTSGFRHTIVVFNPTDPLLIVFAIAGLIVLGYFIVYFVKLAKAEKERRKAIRLRLNETVEDDGTK